MRAAHISLKSRRRSSLVCFSGQPFKSELYMISFGTKLSRLFISTTTRKAWSTGSLKQYPFQRGEGNDDNLNGRLSPLFEKRRRAMHDIALGAELKHGDECHRDEANAPLLHFLIRAEDLLRTHGHGEAFKIGGVSYGVDADGRALLALLHFPESSTGRFLLLLASQML